MTGSASVLPLPRRLKRPGDFAAAFREGVRAATPTVVVHMRRATLQDPPGSTRVGFVVSKKVGNAVMRNRVKRRLRHIVADLKTPTATDVVVRALPEAADDPRRLVGDVRDAWDRAFAKVARC